MPTQDVSLSNTFIGVALTEWKLDLIQVGKELYSMKFPGQNQLDNMKSGRALSLGSGRGSCTTNQLLDIHWEDLVLS